MGCLWSPRVFTIRARKRITQDKYTCLNTAENGHLGYLKSHNGCPWDEGTCKTAAKYGHLKC